MGAARKPATGRSKATGGEHRGKPVEPVVAPPVSFTVEIRGLVRDPGFQVRAGLDDATVHRYSNALAEGCIMPPIRVAAVNGALVVVDGWHRVAAHERRGIDTIEAVVTEETTSEARWLAASANLAHGLPLRKAEIRTVFRVAIKARKHIAKPTKGAMMPGTLLSYRDLAKLLGGLVRHTTLQNWMRADFPDTARRMAQVAHLEGQREAERDNESVFYNTILAALDTAAANAAAVRDPARRGALVEAAQATVAKLQQGGTWVPWEF